jgi:hypothetical protein
MQPEESELKLTDRIDIPSSTMGSGKKKKKKKKKKAGSSNRSSFDSRDQGPLKSSFKSRNHSSDCNPDLLKSTQNSKVSFKEDSPEV